MKELYTAPELDVLYMVSRESLAANSEVDMDDLIAGATNPTSMDPDLGEDDIDVTLP